MSLDEMSMQEGPWGENDYEPTCQRCGGTGEILFCIDDICRNVGECIHGDGYIMCPDCKGRGEIA